jgi:hypothetical protein
MLTKLPASRAVAIAGGALLIAAFAGLMPINWTSARPEKLTLVYVGAQNCAPCDIWQRNQGAVFRNSAEFRRLAFREVKSLSLFDVMNDENWPKDLRIYRQAISRSAGVPLWLIIADDHLVMQSFGLTQWEETVLPKLTSLLR